VVVLHGLADVVRGGHEGGAPGELTGEGIE
jgi:hypothetical protein